MKVRYKLEYAMKVCYKIEYVKSYRYGRMDHVLEGHYGIE